MDDKKKILALDDQISMQNILKFALKKDFDITVVGKSYEAIDKAKSSSFDFILLDITLDEDTMDGIGVAQQLQNAGVTTPVAFLSSMTPEGLDDDQKERVSRLTTVRFYQTKPIAPPELTAKIKNVTG